MAAEQENGDMRDEAFVQLTLHARQGGHLNVSMIGDSHIRRMWEGNKHYRVHNIELKNNFGLGGATFGIFGGQIQRAEAHENQIVLISIGGNDLDREGVPNKEICVKIFRTMIRLELAGKTCFFVQVVNRFRTRVRARNLFMSQVRSLNRIVRTYLGDRYIPLPSCCEELSAYIDEVHLKPEIYTEVVELSLYKILEVLESGACRPTKFLDKIQVYVDRHSGSE